MARRSASQDPTALERLRRALPLLVGLVAAGLLGSPAAVAAPTAIAPAVVPAARPAPAAVLAVPAAHPAAHPAVVPGPRVASPRSKLRAIQKRLQALQDKAELAAERYNGTRERIASLQVRATAAKARMAQQQRRVKAAQRELGRIAAETYKGAGLSSLELFLGDDADAALARSGLLANLLDRRQAVVDQVRAERDRLARDVADVQAQANRIAATRTVMRSSRASVLDALAQTRAQLSQLQEGELAALAREARNGDRAAISRATGKPVPANGRVSCRDIAMNPPNDRVAAVLDYACDQLGEPYVWGAAGPSSFDCSGLTMRAWARAGVSLPHNAAMQARYGKPVSPTKLRPGDLVFYNASYSHMGMYIGSGLMIHAPHTGDVVRIAPVRYGSLVKATRL